MAASERARWVLDRWARPTRRVVGRSVSSFHLFGGLGYGAGVAAAVLVGPGLGVSRAAVGALGLLAVVTFFGLVVVVRFLTGEETLTFWWHALLLAGAATAVAAVVGGSIAAVVDVVAIGLAVFLVFGRLGCFSVGCCHGRPARRGVRYGADHADEGFAPHLVGVTLAPVQLFEATAIGLLAIGAIVFALGDPPPGSVAAGLALGYASVRFALEALRGDPVRAVVRGVSSGQLTSLAIAVFVIGLWAAGVVEVPLLAAVVAAGAAVVDLRVGWRLYRWRTLVRVVDPRHVQELAEVLERVADVDPSLRRTRVDLQRTSEGLWVSSAGPGLFTFSLDGAVLSPPAAAAIGTLLGRLHHGNSEVRVMDGGDGVFHVAVTEQATA